MRRLIASEFVTLDGVMEAPGHEPHPDGRNAWALRHAGEDQQRFKVDEVFQAGPILLGRVTYEIFAAFWPTAPKDHGSPIGARALTQAADRDVVVTRTVRDMATGTDLAFGSLGSVSLRGVPGEWELFNVSVG